MINNSAITYRCSRHCSIGKKCFVIKLTRPLEKPIEVLQKCPALKRDIKLILGEEEPP